MRKIVVKNYDELKKYLATRVIPEILKRDPPLVPQANTEFINAFGGEYRSKIREAYKEVISEFGLEENQAATLLLNTYGMVLTNPFNKTPPDSYYHLFCIIASITEKVPKILVRIVVGKRGVDKYKDLINQAFGGDESVERVFNLYEVKDAIKDEAELIESFRSEEGIISIGPDKAEPEAPVDQANESEDDFIDSDEEEGNLYNDDIDDDNADNFIFAHRKTRPMARALISKRHKIIEDIFRLNKLKLFPSDSVKVVEFEASKPASERDTRKQTIIFVIEQMQSVVGLQYSFDFVLYNNEEPKFSFSNPENLFQYFFGDLEDTLEQELSILKVFDQDGGGEETLSEVTAWPEPAIDMMATKRGIKKDTIDSKISVETKPRQVMFYLRRRLLETQLDFLFKLKSMFLTEFYKIFIQKFIEARLDEKEKKQARTELVLLFQEEPYKLSFRNLLKEVAFHDLGEGSKAEEEGNMAYLMSGKPIKEHPDQRNSETKFVHDLYNGFLGSNDKKEYGSLASWTMKVLSDLYPRKVLEKMELGGAIEEYNIFERSTGKPIYNIIDDLLEHSKHDSRYVKYMEEWYIALFFVIPKELYADFLLFPFIHSGGFPEFSEEMEPYKSHLKRLLNKPFPKFSKKKLIELFNLHYEEISSRIPGIKEWTKAGQVMARNIEVISNLETEIQSLLPEGTDIQSKISGGFQAFHESFPELQLSRRELLAFIGMPNYLKRVFLESNNENKWYVFYIENHLLEEFFKPGLSVKAFDGVINIFVQKVAENIPKKLLGGMPNKLAYLIKESTNPYSWLALCFYDETHAAYYGTEEKYYDYFLEPLPTRFKDAGERKKYVLAKTARPKNFEDFIEEVLYPMYINSFGEPKVTPSIPQELDVERLQKQYDEYVKQYDSLIASKNILISKRRLETGLDGALDPRSVDGLIERLSSMEEVEERLSLGKTNLTREDKKKIRKLHKAIKSISAQLEQARSKSDIDEKVLQKRLDKYTERLHTLEAINNSNPTPEAEEKIRSLGEEIKLISAELEQIRSNFDEYRIKTRVSHIIAKGGESSISRVESGPLDAILYNVMKLNSAGRSVTEELRGTFVAHLASDKGLGAEKEREEEAGSMEKDIEKSLSDRGRIEAAELKLDNLLQFISGGSEEEKSDESGEKESGESEEKVKDVEVEIPEEDIIDLEAESDVSLEKTKTSGQADDAFFTEQMAEWKTIIDEAQKGSINLLSLRVHKVLEDIDTFEEEYRLNLLQKQKLKNFRNETFALFFNFKKTDWLTKIEKAQQENISLFSLKVSNVFEEINIFKDEYHLTPLQKQELKDFKNEISSLVANFKKTKLGGSTEEALQTLGAPKSAEEIQAQAIAIAEKFIASMKATSNIKPYLGTSEFKVETNPHEPEVKDSEFELYIKKLMDSTASSKNDLENQLRSIETYVVNHNLSEEKMKELRSIKKRVEHGYRVASFNEELAKFSREFQMLSKDINESRTLLINITEYIKTTPFLAEQAEAIEELKKALESKIIEDVKSAEYKDSGAASDQSEKRKGFYKELERKEKLQYENESRHFNGGFTTDGEVQFRRQWLALIEREAERKGVPSRDSRKTVIGWKPIFDNVMKTLEVVERDKKARYAQAINFFEKEWSDEAEFEYLKGSDVVPEVLKNYWKNTNERFKNEKSRLTKVRAELKAKRDMLKKADKSSKVGKLLEREIKALKIKEGVYQVSKENLEAEMNDMTRKRLQSAKVGSVLYKKRRSLFEKISLVERDCKRALDDIKSVAGDFKAKLNTFFVSNIKNEEGKTWNKLASELLKKLQNEIKHTYTLSENRMKLILSPKNQIKNIGGDSIFRLINKTFDPMPELEAEISELVPYAKDYLGFDKPVTIHLDHPSNSDNMYMPTGQYNPSTNTVVVFVSNRHPKDILRSLTHELVHHSQNCRGEFIPSLMGDGAVEGYAQKNKHLRRMEEEAYGNMCFRDFENTKKGKQKKVLSEGKTTWEKMWNKFSKGDK